MAIPTPEQINELEAGLLEGLHRNDHCAFLINETRVEPSRAVEIFESLLTDKDALAEAISGRPGLGYIISRALKGSTMLGGFTIAISSHGGLSNSINSAARKFLVVQGELIQHTSLARPPAAKIAALQEREPNAFADVMRLRPDIKLTPPTKSATRHPTRPRSVTREQPLSTKSPEYERAISTISTLVENIDTTSARQISQLLTRDARFTAFALRNRTDLRDALAEALMLDDAKFDAVTARLPFDLLTGEMSTQAIPGLTIA